MSGSRRGNSIVEPILRPLSEPGPAPPLTLAGDGGTGDEGREDTRDPLPSSALISSFAANPRCPAPFASAPISPEGS